MIAPLHGSRIWWLACYGERFSENVDQHQAGLAMFGREAICVTAAPDRFSGSPLRQHRVLGMIPNLIFIFFIIHS